MKRLLIGFLSLFMLVASSQLAQAQASSDQLSKSFHLKSQSQSAKADYEFVIAEEDETQSSKKNLESAPALPFIFTIADERSSFNTSFPTPLLTTSSRYLVHQVFRI